LDGAVRTVTEDAAKLDAKRAVIDGEMVVLREDGTCDFWALQKPVATSSRKICSVC
jgi:ATP-dependent DNA ligase